ncbi:MAG: DNA repair exonuclease [Planctomycetes bacterium]|nr:DNA repair exonuclease [Planctomycetota bacterium]
MPVKFLHTADWQLGMKALQAGEKAREVRAARFDAVERALRLAVDEAVDFVLVAGDTFEDPDVDDSVIRRAVDLLEQLAPMPVFVLPGNHDPLVPGGVWERASWRQAGDHVTLFRERTEVAAGPHVALYPCPLTQKQSGIDPTAWIPAREAGDQRMRIGVAHGALDILPDRVNFPIDGGRAESSGLDYLALGDWHGLHLAERIAYPGTIEPSAFGERDPGHVLVVEIDGARRAPRVRPLRVAGLRWWEANPKILDPTDVEQLERAIASLGAPEKLVLRLAPRPGDGCPEEAFAALENLRARLADRAFFLDWTEPTAVASGTAALEGLLAAADADLASILDGRIPDGPGREFASLDPEVAREARVLLGRLAKEADA